jgi:hypothetical protein
MQPKLLWQSTKRRTWDCDVERVTLYLQWTDYSRDTCAHFSRMYSPNGVSDSRAAASAAVCPRAPTCCCCSRLVRIAPSGSASESRAEYSGYAKKTSDKRVPSAASSRTSSVSSASARIE